MFIVFDASGSDKTNWFKRNNILESSFTDIRTYQPINYFSIDGYVNHDQVQGFRKSIMIEQMCDDAL